MSHISRYTLQLHKPRGTSTWRHRKTFDDTDISNDFLNETPIAQEIKARIGKQDCFCIAKEIITRIKGQSTEWKKPLPAIHQIKD
jgi:hypothetical protein